MTDDWRDIVFETWRHGQRIGAVGPGAVEVHLDLAVGLVRNLEPPEVVVDLGTGAGIPGLALAGLWPETEFLLVDAALRRIAVVERAVEELGWGSRVAARHARAEDLGRDEAWRERVDLVVARSFGPPAMVAECGAPLLRPGGELVVAEPPAGEDDRWPAEGVAVLGLTLVDDDGEEPRRQRLRRTDSVEQRFPRRAGPLTKRPLF